MIRSTTTWVAEDDNGQLKPLRLAKGTYHGPLDDDEDDDSDLEDEGGESCQ